MKQPAQINTECKYKPFLLGDRLQKKGCLTRKHKIKQFSDGAASFRISAYFCWQNELKGSKALPPQNVGIFEINLLLLSELARSSKGIWTFLTSAVAQSNPPPSNTSRPNLKRCFLRIKSDVFSRTERIDIV